MSLISLPNELLLRHIFSCDSISINDLKCIMLSCHRLYKIIHESNELWRLKFLTRWPRVSLQKDQRWFECVSLRLKVSKMIKKCVGTMSAIYHPNGIIPMSILDKLIEKGETERLTLLFVEDELRDLAFNQEKNENLTLSYYASALLDTLKRFKQIKDWQEFRAQQPSHKSLLKGAVLISLWFQCFDAKQFVSLSEIECSLEKISQKIKQNILLMENAPSKVNESFIDPIKNGRKLINMINKVLFNDMGFRVTFNEDHDEDLLSIQMVLETGEGCSTILCIIYYEIARILGIKCDLVYFKDKLLLRWREYSQCPEKLNAYSIFYIDVCDGGFLKHYVYYPSEIHYKPAASVEHIFQQMMHEFNESVKEIIRTEDDPIYIFHLKSWQADSVRLACAITPHWTPRIMEYAELCINDGMYLDDAIQLLQSVGREDDDSLIVRCKNELARYQEEVDAAKIPCLREPSIKYAVGLVMNYTYEDEENEEMRNNTCVIVSWDVMFKESKEWTTGKGVYNLDQPYYHILLDNDSPGFTYPYFYGHFNVAEETLELHPTGVRIQHQEIGNHFERFDGRKYVPNAEVRTHFPEDEAAAIAMIAGR